MANSVLLVDDDEDLRDLMIEILKLNGHQVEAVDNGLIADGLLEQKTYDLVLIDWDLPGLSGPEVCKNYRARGGTSQVVLMTGMDPKLVAQAVESAGASSYILKPFTLDQFSNAINKALAP